MALVLAVQLIQRVQKWMVGNSHQRLLVRWSLVVLDWRLLSLSWIAKLKGIVTKFVWCEVSM